MKSAYGDQEDLARTLAHICDPPLGSAPCPLGRAPRPPLSHGPRIGFMPSRGH